MINLFQKITSKKIEKRLTKSLEKAENTRSKDIDATRKTWNSLRKIGISDYNEFYNVCLYSSIVYNDISILFDNYTTSKSRTQKNLFGRLLCMTIIEFLDDINPLIGRDLKKELESNNLSEFTEELKIIGKEFALLKKGNNTELRIIRNNSAAHKTKKAEDLINFTKEIPFKNLDEFANQVSITNSKLTQLTTRIIKKVTEQVEQRFANK